MLFNTIDCEEAAYWLGFIAADGCVTTDGKRDYLVVVLAEEDEEHLRTLATWLKAKVWGPYPSRGFGEGGQNHFRMHCFSQEIVDGLARWGVGPRKTWTVRPPELPVELMCHYWRGVFDGDGWISFKKNINGGEVGLVGNEYMAQGFANFLEAATGRPFGVYPNRSAWRCQVGGVTKPQAAMRILYDNSTVYLPRKKVAVERLLAMRSKKLKQQSS